MTLINKDLFSLFKGKRIFITGDTGFKGSWLSLWLSELGAEVLGYALPPERDNDHFNLLKLDKIITHIDGDIRDLNLMKNVFDEFQPQFLFHLAAQSLVRRSYKEPKLTFETNIQGSVNILELIRMSKSLRSVIYVTSDKCYKNNEWLWGYRENDNLGGHDPYSASKAGAEIVFSSYNDSFLSEKENLGVASVRAGNVIGGGDWAPDRIVTDTMLSLINNNTIIIRNPESTRPWQHVLDPLCGYLTLSAKLFEEPKKYSGSWNFGPKVESIKTVHELTEKIINYWGKGKIKVIKETNEPHEAGLLHLNCDKANQLLKWYPHWDFDKAVYETARWYKEFCEHKPALQITMSQINEFMEVK